MLKMHSIFGKTQARFGHLFSSLFCSEFLRERSKKLFNLKLSVKDFALDQQGMNDCTLLNVGSARLLFSGQLATISTTFCRAAEWTIYVPCSVK